MKMISVRFNVYQGNWLKMQAKMQGVQCSEYVRDLITAQMEKPHFFEYFKTMEDKRLMSITEKKYLIYSLMVYKLIEQLVLNQEEGQNKLEMAYSDTLDWLKRLKVHPSEAKNYKLSFLLYPEQLAWLNQQSTTFKKSTAIIIRKIVDLASRPAVEKKSNFGSNPDLMEVQKEELKAVLMTYTLLKTYIVNAYAGGEKLVTSCYESAQALYNKLYSAS